MANCDICDGFMMINYCHKGKLNICAHCSLAVQYPTGGSDEEEKKLKIKEKMREKHIDNIKIGIGRSDNKENE